MGNEPRRKGRPRSFQARAGQTGIRAVERALDVLDALAGAEGLTLTDLANALGQSPATMYRVLSTLEARRIVEIDPVSQTWHIGAMAFRLGSAFLRRSSLAERSRPVMRALMQATGETSNLGIERDGEVMFIGQVETHESIRAFFAPGTLSPMHASGIGKALLGCYSDGALDRFLRRATLDRFTAMTIVSPDALRADLALGRARGWALDDEEKATGMRCVAAAITDIYGEAVAGISVSGPTHRMERSRLERIGALVGGAAREISQGMGAPAPA
ncbi:MAG: IclR family transcriptional regulator [Rhodobacteraceae bacterium]|nr:IclR family transcriptional regulator [Paracoccaceae bacterium]